MKIEYYKMHDRWWWKVTINKVPLAYSARGYSRKSDAVRAFNKLDRLF